MSDRDQPSDAPEHADVSALLAAEPDPVMPTDVADRLQAALRAESASRASGPRAGVTPIGSARRRRVLPALAAAAVVVGVVAVGGAALVQGGGGSDSAESSSAAGGGAAETESADPAAPEPGTLAQPDGGAADGRRLAEAQEAVDTGLAPPVLDSAPADLTCTDGQLDVASVLSVSYEGSLGFLVTLPGGASTAREYVVYGCDGDTARRLTVLTPTG